MQGKRIDPAVLNAWHPVAALGELNASQSRRTRVLGTTVTIARAENGELAAWAHDASAPPPADSGRNGARLTVIPRYGYAWVCLGNPQSDLFALPEYAEPDRRNLNAASVGVSVSAPRVIENFLDMGHLPFVHAGILGVENHAEVRDYFVEVRSQPDEIVATRCFAYQPQSAVNATDGAEIEYIFRVPHPYCSVLYKSSAADPHRMDVIAIFAQALDEEHVCAHMLLSMLDSQNADVALRCFQQVIFGQDKPIIENQIPKRLPLDPRAELPVRSDASSIAYRRWLRSKGVTYGTLA
jgi:phenylpropionate dioxygenase-like ring-hydroxylating dioxygenase large terminal subunit